MFQDYALPRGELRWRGRTIDPSAIRRTALVTVEGERDDICAPGQTLAAQDLCSKLRPYMRTHTVQAGVGHYGVFSGRKWQQHIYPMLRDVIHVSQWIEHRAHGVRCPAKGLRRLGGLTAVARYSGAGIVGRPMNIDSRASGRVGAASVACACTQSLRPAAGRPSR